MPKCGGRRSPEATTPLFSCLPPRLPDGTPPGSSHVTWNSTSSSPRHRNQGKSTFFTTRRKKIQTSFLISTGLPWDTGREQKVKPSPQPLTEFPGLNGKFSTILIDPPWRFLNRTGKVAPEHHRLHRYETMSFEQIAALPVSKHAEDKAHLYMWCPNALLLEGLTIMKQWGFTYKTNIVWFKIRKDGGPDGRGVGFYFRNVTELLLFGIRGSMRTLQPGRTQVNLFSTRKREHSRKPDEIYDVIEACSPGPYLEMFARFRRNGWNQWGNEDVEKNSLTGVAMRKAHIDSQMR